MGITRLPSGCCFNVSCRFVRWALSYPCRLALTEHSSYGASGIAPGLSGIAADFGVSREVATISITTYVLGLGLGPLVSSGLSETYGRKAINILSVPLCMLFIMGAGLSQNITSLLILRFLAGAASSGPLTNGAGSIADIFPPQLRGFATGIWLMGPFLGPALGLSPPDLP